MFTGFKNFLMRGDLIVVAVGLAVALAFSALIASFTANIINPLVARAQGGHALGLGVQLGSDNNKATFLNFGSLISAIIYFVVFMLVAYYLIVVPYRRIQARRGVTVFGAPAPVKTCDAGDPDLALARRPDCWTVCARRRQSAGGMESQELDAESSGHQARLGRGCVAVRAAVAARAGGDHL